MSRTVSPARWLRATVLAGSSVGLATTAHLFGGGHADPVFLGLLLATATVAGHHWTRRERGLVAITLAVVTVQASVHLMLGHPHAGRSGMLMAHAVAAVLLAAFLRWGEARLHAAARRRYLRWVVALRLALAGAPLAPATGVLLPEPPPVLGSMWCNRVLAGRGPPAAACC